MIVTVDDPADGRLDDYRDLNDQRHRRRYEGDRLFIAEGFVAVDRLIESGHRVRSVLLAPSRRARFDHAEDLAAAGTPVVVAPPEVIAAVVGFDAHRGVLASADRRPLPSVEELLDTSPRVAVLEGLNDAENLGAIARAARAFGFDGLVIDPTCTDPYSRRTVRVSMGEILGLPVARAGPATWTGIGDLMEASGHEVWAMTPSPGADDLWRLPVPTRVAICLGAEGPGLTTRLLDTADRRVRIPIQPTVDSLNVGHAAAVTFAAIGRPDAPRV